MAKISVPDFIEELDSYFAREDLRGAGECLLRRREKTLNERADRIYAGS
ncbi:MAG: hypothetical protein ACI4JG_04045 [Acutalibacteraceae bacterium]